jgi:hypothetical protein
MVVVAGSVGDAAPVEVILDDAGGPALLPSCTSAVGEAAPAIRLTSFAEQFPQRNKLTTICNEDISDGLIILADLLAKTLGVPCVEGEVDLDPTVPGVQHECYVSDIRYPGEDRQEETLLPPCSDSTPEPGEMPCWRFVVYDAACPDTPTHTVLVVERGAADVAHGTHTILRCALDGCPE